MGILVVPDLLLHCLGMRFGWIPLGLWLILGDEAGDGLEGVSPAIAEFGIHVITGYPVIAEDGILSVAEHVHLGTGTIHAIELETYLGTILSF
jgi:hypothetical protein